MLQLATFSIAARCARTGQLGVAVSTAVPAVGGRVPWIEAGVGAAASQAWSNPYLAIDALAALRGGATAEAALASVLDLDPARKLRQIGLVDREGRSSAWTGPDCTPWAGHRTGPDFAAQGNMLVGEATVTAMSEAFERTGPLELLERLMIALEAAQAAGGDKRGKQSAALRVVDTEAYPLLDLRVDEHRHPVAELRRILEVAKQQLLPLARGTPRRGGEADPLPDDVKAMILTPPPYRPGGSGA